MLTEQSEIEEEIDINPKYSQPSNTQLKSNKIFNDELNPEDLEEEIDQNPFYNYRMKNNQKTSSSLLLIEHEKSTSTHSLAEDNIQQQINHYPSNQINKNNQPSLTYNNKNTNHKIDDIKFNGNHNKNFKNNNQIKNNNNVSIVSSNMNNKQKSIQPTMIQQKNNYKNSNIHNKTMIKSNNLNKLSPSSLNKQDTKDVNEQNEQGKSKYDIIEDPYDIIQDFNNTIAGNESTSGCDQGNDIIFTDQDEDEESLEPVAKEETPVFVNINLSNMQRKPIGGLKKVKSKANFLLKPKKF